MKLFRLGFMIIVALAALTATGKAATIGISCVTRSVQSNYSGSNWMSQTVCQQNEVAISAGGFCSQAGNMKGASTTTGTADRLVWLWCSQNGAAYWYAMCCKTP